MIGEGYALAPRIPSLNTRDELDGPGQVLGPRIPSRVMPRDSATTSATSSSTCLPGDNSNLCEKPVGSNAMTLPIVLGVAIPLVAAISVLIYLHRRNVKRQRREDATDPHKSLDFGLGEPGDKGARGNRKSILGKEKDHNSRFKQMSMDLNLSSPYLLPPGLQSSRESLHSLARTLHQNEDPYRPVAQYAASDAASVRSAQKGPDGSSVYTGSGHDRESSRQPRPIVNAGGFVAPPRHNSLPKSPPPPPKPVHMKAHPSIPELETPPPELPAKDPFRSPSEKSLPSIESSPYPHHEPALLVMPTAPEIQEPPPTAQRIARKPMLDSQPAVSGNEVGFDVAQHNQQDDVHQAHETISEKEPAHIDYRPMEPRSPPQQQVAAHMLPPAVSLPVGPHHQRSGEPPAPAPILEEPEEYYDYGYPQMPQEHYEHQDYYGQEERGRSMYRESSGYAQAENGQLGLGIPMQDTRRLSVGFRPLPPDELMDTDPETRANRIRSFYKEYFDESRPEAAHHQQQGGGVDYYEDYDPNYNSEAPYYDPDSNAFVMPYAQPVARRAMTPPPSGSRFPGPHGPRGYHGSVGGMSLPGGRGPLRPGSSASNRYGPPRSGTSMSAAWGRPRAGSSVSGTGSRWGAPKKPLPPPSTLSTLPNPSKLRDDSFALLGSIEFAPPETFKDRAAGRAQSPAGERRPYQLNVPIHSPLVNAFEELPTLPSPHLLRKSGTFTALDFAAPRKFTESDSRSETGSIRSNRSGISAAQLGAIRSGAGRVSRLPGDTIFSQAQMQHKLKPSWTMRD